MKYRRLPLEIEAVQWKGDEIRPNKVPEWLWNAFKNGICFFTFRDGYISGLSIETLEGTMMAREGDYIIKGIDGEIYPCQAHIFKRIYEVKQ